MSSAAANPDRRTMLAVLLAGVASPALAQMSTLTAYGFSFSAPDGKPIQLADYTGRPMLIVNTATLCGFAPQMKGLQDLSMRFGARGLAVIGVPSNDFGGQEPAGDKEIVETAHHQHGVSFPMAGKVSVRGPNPHPFYKWAALERPTDTPRWNFHKYLIGRDGHIAESFGASVEPADTRLVTAISRQLDASGKG